MQATGLQLKEGGDNLQNVKKGEPFYRSVKVLAVDDEEMNLEILMKHLTKAQFDTTPVASGEAAWEYLNKYPGAVDIVILDKMMPGMSGIELLAKIKAEPKFRNLMVILQTASVGTAEMIEGIQAGAYYYITKPYAAELLLSITRAAARDYLEMEQLRGEITHKARILDITEICHFSLRTPEDAQALSLHLASFFENPMPYCTGLNALFSNAIEHGNLGIGLDLKRQCLNEGTLEQEIQRRLALPEHTNKKVLVSFQKLPEAARIMISDEGKGFDWKPFQQLNPEHLTAPNGRGIAIASLAKEYTIEYLGNGSKVCMTIPVHPSDTPKSGTGAGSSNLS